MIKQLSTMASAAALMLSAPANAALIERSFVVTGFYSSGPLSTLNIAINISFDNSKDIESTRNGFSVISDLPDHDLKYAYRSLNDLLLIGTNVSPAAAEVSSAKNDLAFLIFGASTASARPSSISYSTSSGKIYNSGSVKLVSTDLTSAVPEPATWAMMILGFGMVGAAARRRRQHVGVSFS
ncbi:PEPxxWA-CTERM sorting domain-containing protein [Sphingomonas endophytica]|uniref:PEPxxWA-CTERM sorting domain-containing protein n=1 Tax=Sphingomonas endophytica TaxID=869719 RepID=UPI0009F93108|nr:PEPxxWA-CTERM sorting domain-containing protein [Sphingomonas endophytica]